MSARREARRSAAVLEVDGKLLNPPVELLSADHPLWRDRAAYAAWMAEHGWDMPAGDRLPGPLGGTSPANRRNHAADQWAREHQVFRRDPSVAGGASDWNRLRRAGLIGAGEDSE